MPRSQVVLFRLLFFVILCNGRTECDADADAFSDVCFQLNLILNINNLKVKVCTVDIVPLSELSPRKHSGIAHVLKRAVLHAHAHVHPQVE